MDEIGTSETGKAALPGFLRAFVAVCAWALMLVAVINYLVDPFGIYGTGLFPQVTANRYRNKLELFSAYQPRPGALILGSSRVGMIDPEWVTEITGVRCFAWGVPVARAETYYSILRIALEEFEAPIELVVVGVEPEVFHPASSVHPMARFAPEYSGYTEGLPWWTVTGEKFARLFSMEQVHSSLEVVIREIRGEEAGDWIEWGPDGFPMGIDEERRPGLLDEDFGTRLERGILTYPDERFEISTFTELSQDRMEYWEEFLAICRERGIRVYAFMPPPHPELLDRLYELGAEPIFNETAEFLERTVNEVGGTFRDYTLLDSFGGNPDLFGDEVHLKSANAELLLRDLLSDFSDGDKMTD